MNNLEYFRIISGLTPKEISEVLKVSVHTYRAYETESLTVDAVVLIMISKIYGICYSELFKGKESLSENTVSSVSRYKDMKMEDRMSEMYKSLTNGELTKATYRDIRKVKEKIIKDYGLDGKSHWMM